MKYEIYSDMDGVITDFDAQFKKLSGGISPSVYDKKEGLEKFWGLIDDGGVGFWVGMPWMEDGKTYWDYIKKYKPILLSSRSKDKQNYSGENKILIDDRPSNITEWRSQGGIGILHTSAANTIAQLKELGI